VVVVVGPEQLPALLRTRQGRGSPLPTPGDRLPRRPPGTPAAALPPPDELDACACRMVVAAGPAATGAA